jgi:hypothetical protein
MDAYTTQNSMACWCSILHSTLILLAVFSVSKKQDRRCRKGCQAGWGFEMFASGRAVVALGCFTEQTQIKIA